MTRYALLSSLILCSSFANFTYAEQLTLEVVDEAGQSLPARVRVRDQSDTDHVAAGSLKIPLGIDQWFITPGISKLDVPNGQVEIRVEHGLEYQPYKQVIDVKASENTQHCIQLKRWINMHEFGYLNGENHLHVPLPELGPQLVAEGLDFGTSLYWWNAKRYDTPLEGGHVRGLEFAGRTVPTSVFDYEIEHNWGAVYVIGQPVPLDADSKSEVPNLPILRRSHQAGALVCYQGGWSREVLLDALLGYVDIVNICNNNFLRHAYQPRSRYSNLLEVPDFPVYANNADDMLRMNTETYYRLLNCGLRLAAGAGSATGPKRSPVGYNRAYVRMGGKTSLQEFLEQWRAGKNFVTNGPMLLLTVDQQHRPGDTIELKAGGGKLSTEVIVHSPQPLTSLEIVVNGQIAHQATEAELKAAVIRIPIEIAAGAWLVARCTTEDQLLSDQELAAYEWGKPKMPRKSTRLRFAHTSPIYINVAGRGTRVDHSIQEAHAMLDALEKFSRKEADAESLVEIKQALKEARRRLGE